MALAPLKIKRINQPVCIGWAAVHLAGPWMIWHKSLLSQAWSEREERPSKGCIDSASENEGKYILKENNSPENIKLI